MSIRKGPIGFSVPPDEDIVPSCTASKPGQCLDRSGIQGNGAGLARFRKGGRHGQKSASHVHIVPLKGKPLRLNSDSRVDRNGQQTLKWFGTLGQEPGFFLSLKISESLLWFLREFDANDWIDSLKQVPFKTTIEKILKEADFTIRSNRRTGRDTPTSMTFDIQPTDLAEALSRE